MMVKMKRRDFNQFNDDFSDFSLSSSARKIRRLNFQNAELPPIMEEEEHPEISVSREGPFSPASQDHAVTVNQESAIVLLEPVNEHFFQASTVSSLSATVHSNLISGIKNDLFRATHFGSLNRAEDEDRSSFPSENATNGCMAVVPWIQSEFFPAQIMTKPPELMDSKVDSDNAMDAEQNSNDVEQQSRDYGATNSGWYQKHCMIPQLTQNSPAPILWLH